MSAQAITIRPLVRPQFDNSHIQFRGMWELDNAKALADYWTACGNALGMTEEDLTEFGLWLRHQWEQEKSAVAKEVL